MCTKNHHIMHASWDMGCDRHLSFWATFYPFTQLLTLKIKIWTKWKKNPGDIILLHLCTINENHMMYGSWEVVAQRTEFFVILGHFLPFDPHLTTRKIKILKNENKGLEILSFHTCVPQMRRSYDVWFLRYGARKTEFFLILDQFLPF